MRHLAARRALSEGLVLLVFAALAGAMLWPWPLHLANGVSDPGDPYLNAWTLWWDFHQTFHAPAHLFDANLFYPYKETLAFSEHLYGIAILFFPLFAAGVTPLAVNGLATILGFALSGYGAFRLARTLTGSTGAGWVAGISFAFVPYRFHLLSHLGYLFAGWIPLLLEALVLFLRERSRRRAAWLAVALAMNGLTSIHWLILTPIPLGVTAILLIRRGGLARDGVLFRRGAAAVLFASLVLLPFVLPYRRVARRHGFVRDAKEAASYSALPRHWLTADPNNRLFTNLGERPVRGELCLFPGFLTLLLAAAGSVAGLSKARRDAALAGLVFAAAGFFGSLGMNFPFHRLLFEYVPLFRSLRVPARWAMVGDAGLALLAGVGALALASLVRGRRLSPGPAPNGIFALLCAALLFEQRVAPIGVFRGEPDPDEVTKRLKAIPFRGGLVELPDGGPRGNFRYVLRAADHGKPLVDAYSGFEPPIAAELRHLNLARPIPARLLDLLEEIPASYVVVHESWYEPEERAVLHAFLWRALGSGRLRFIRRFDGRAGNDLYAVTGVEPDALPEMPLPWAPGPETQGPSLPSREDLSLPCAVDAPAAEGEVRGELVVTGWARAAGDDLDVRILIDGEIRTPAVFRRFPRLDLMTAALSYLGDTSTAGYEARYPFLDGDDGRHELTARFRARDGRTRHYPIRRFVWKR